MGLGAKSYEILSRIITQSAPPLDVMNFKILNSPARLATLPISLQAFMAMLAPSLGGKSQPGSPGSDPRQTIACMFSRSCLISGDSTSAKKFHSGLTSGRTKSLIQRSERKPVVPRQVQVNRIICG
jgi:hypothetical protein